MSTLIYSSPYVSLANGITNQYLFFVWSCVTFLGSLTESVITAYESHSVIINKKSMSAASLPEEGGENSPDNSAFGAPKGDFELMSIPLNIQG